MRIIYSDRKTLSIEVPNSTEVVVRAPRRLSGRKIDAFVESRREWIEESRRRLAAREQAAGPPLTPEDVASLRESAQVDLLTRVSRWSKDLGVRPSRVTIRNQKSRWGSCSSRGAISLNCQLMRFDEPERDYVVVHELCHLLEFNHSRKFWEHVGRCYPDYPEAKKKLSSSLILRVGE